MICFSFGLYQYRLAYYTFGHTTLRSGVGLLASCLSLDTEFTGGFGSRTNNKSERLSALEEFNTTVPSDTVAEKTA